MQLSFPNGHIVAAVADRGNLLCVAAGRGQRPRLQLRVASYETFCGGIFETNCYLIDAPEGASYSTRRMGLVTGWSRRASRRSCSS